MHPRTPAKWGARASLLLILCLIAAAPVTAVHAQDSEAEETEQPQFREPPVAERVALKATAAAGDAAQTAVVLQANEQEEGDTLCLTYGQERPGPTIYMDPGGSHQVFVENLLEGFTPDQLRQFNPPVLRTGETEELAAFISASSSITNLHTHGLHVTPRGRSDNVLLRIEPGHSNLYTLDLPSNHAPGTHWYHAHLHGSTALQVQGGMSGALIVRPPEGQELDPPGFTIDESIMVIQVDCSAPPADQLLTSPTTLAQVEALDAEALPAALRTVTEAENAEALDARIEALSEPLKRSLADALGKLAVAPPRFLVNRLQEPEQWLTAGTFQRLRIVNSGSRKADFKEIWLEGQDLYLAAFDGVNLTHLPKDSSGQYVAYNQANPLSLAPGNRADLYFLPTEGSAQLMMRAQSRVRMTDDSQILRSFTQRLMSFRVKAGPEAKTRKAKKKKGATQAEGTGSELDLFLAALDANLVRLQGTQPYQTYLRPFGGAPSLTRQMEFNILGGSKTRTFEINGRDYNQHVDGGGMQGSIDYLGKEARDGGSGPDQQTPWPPRTGSEETWKITNPSGEPHPFHIHVSPFWVYDVDDGNGSLRGTNPNDPRLNRWQDVIVLPPGGSATLWQRFSDFEGLFVVHCHILQHEDRGMMINILLVPSDNQDPAAYFNAEKTANCEINNQINGTSCPCPAGCPH